MELSKKEMAQSVFDAMNNKDFSFASKIFDENIQFDFPGIGTVDGVRKVVVVLTALLRKYKKLHFIVSDIILEKERACVIWTNKGESLKEDLYENSGITLIHFSDDKIVLLSDYFKDTSFVNA